MEKKDPFAFAAALKSLLEKDPNLSKEKLAKRVDISPQRMDDWLALNNVIEPIRKLYREGKIGRIICVRAGYLSPSRQVNYVERIMKRRLVLIEQAEGTHLLSLYIPNDGRNRHEHMQAKFGHEPVSVSLDGVDFLDDVDGATFTWRFADANQMVLAMQDAFTMGLLGERRKQCEVI